jgi:potassium-transporting ATPase KdpC subunit
VSDAEDLLAPTDVLAPRPALLAFMRPQLRPIVLSVMVLTVLTGVIFPLVLGAVARVLFPSQSHGSLSKVRGVVVGSDLIGQEFSGPGYFHPRPSAAGAAPGYDAAASSGTNLGPSSPKLLEGDPQGPFPGIRDLANRYRQINGLSPTTTVPADAVMRSASGLDPHISVANASLQVARVARARGLSEADVLRLVAEYTSARQLGALGAPGVAVLPLNLALDRAARSR